MAAETGKQKKVALALSSGGPRGFAYIGAIEELESRGYVISSIAGTSIGSLIGGIYAAGKLPEVKQWLFDLDVWKVFTLMDISISLNHLVKGDKVIEALKEIVPDTNIEDLKIPYKAIATDFYTGEEVIFDRGNLFQAIRASISIPSLFRPAKIGDRTLIDGGIANTMPLNRVERTSGDILIGFDVNEVDVDSIRAIIREDAEAEEQKKQEDKLETDFSTTQRKSSSMQLDASLPYPRGFFFGLCLTEIFVFRFFIEFLKENQVAFEDSMRLNMGQWLSIPFVIIGIYFMFFYHKHTATR